MSDSVTTWTNTSGNLCFRFTERQVFERPWIMILASIILLTITAAEYLINGTYYSLAPIFITLFFIILWWITIPLKANEAVIERVVHELMNDVVKAAATAKGLNVKRSFVHYDTKGTYAIITGRCFLVLLNNGEVWGNQALLRCGVGPVMDVAGTISCCWSWQLAYRARPGERYGDYGG